MMRNISILLFAFIPLFATADILDDITAGKFKPQPLEQTIAMADGERYAMLCGNEILAYSYKSGKITDTIYSPSIVLKGSSQKIEVNSFILSADNRYVLISTNKNQIFRRSFSADWYLYDTRRREMRVLTSELPVRDPVFSPDGKYIAFVRNNNLFIHKVDYNTEVAVTTDGSADIYNGAADWLYEEEFSTTCLYSFSPDSKQLAFVRFDDTEVPQYSWLEYLDEDGNALRRPELKSLRYSKAGDNNPKATVHVYDTYYKSVKALQLPEQEDSYLPRISWTSATQQMPTGEVIIERLNRAQNRLEIFLANPKSTLSHLLYKEECKDSWVDYQNADMWQWLSDNSFVAVSEKSGYRHAYLYTSQGGEKRQLTQGCYDITDVYAYDTQSATLFFQAAARLQGQTMVQAPLVRNIFALNTKKNTLTQLSAEEGTHSALFSPKGGYFIDCFSSVIVPGTYSVCDRKGSVLRVLKDNSAVAESAKAAGLPTKEFFSFVTEGGDTLNAWRLAPPVSSQSVPKQTLISQYSGPASQQVLNRWRIDWEEYLAAKEDVLCVCVDPRGTNARGRQFRSLTYMNLGEKEAEDLVAAANYLITTNQSDAKRIAIWGWSYGGYQSLKTVFSASSPFCAAIAVAPVTDWKLYDSAYTERYMRRPQTNDTGYDNAAISAANLSKEKTPNLLIVHGLADDNVHVQNTVLLCESLTKAGVQYECELYPDDNHFLRKRSNYQHLYRRMLQFIKRL